MTNEGVVYLKFKDTQETFLGTNRVIVAKQIIIRVVFKLLNY